MKTKHIIGFILLTPITIMLLIFIAISLLNISQMLVEFFGNFQVIIATFVVIISIIGLALVIDEENT